MKIIHEFDDSNWKSMHRLTLVTLDGTRIEGLFALLDDVAILSDVEIRGEKLGNETPVSGYLATTEFYEGVLPRLMRFEALPSNVTYETAQVVARSLTNDDPLCDEIEEREGDDSTFALAP